MPLLGLEPTSTSPERQTSSADGGSDSGTVTDAGKTSGGAPPSFAQQRLWFVDRLRPGSPAYHLPAALRLTGQLDAAVAERSLREVVRRHEALRTVFRTVGGQLIQVVLPDVPCPLPIVDLSHLPPADREAEAARLAAVEFRRAFDLEHGPLLRAGLLRLAAEDHVLWLEVHQIACDGWSLGILFQDFATVYAAFLRGEPSPLPPLPVRYADYAIAQRARMQGKTLREHLTYWKQQLDGLAESLELPTDRPRPVKPALRGGTRVFSLPVALTEALESLGRREVSWLFMTLLAGFQALLQRYTGQTEVAVGTPVADRPRRELRGMIGCFLNVVVMRTELSGDPSFRELLRRVRTMALRAYAHQELPFERLVEELRPASVPGRQPLFQVMFTLLNEPTMGMALPGLEVAPIAVDCGAALYDLRLRMTRTEAGLDGALEYDSDLFDAATIDRMIGHFKALLEAAVADPDYRLSELPLPPLPPNGKVDRAALPAPGWVESGGPRPAVPPRDDTEAELTPLWQEALGQESVSVTEDFFDSGGSSLLAMSLLARIEWKFGTKVPLARFFQTPTIEAVAAGIREATFERPEMRVFALRVEGTQPPLIIVDAGPRYRPLVRWLGGDQPVFGLTLPELSMLPERFSVSDVAANLVEALCASDVRGPYYLAGWSAAGVFAYEMARQLRSRGKEVPLLTLFDMKSPAYWRSYQGWRKFAIHIYLGLEKVRSYLRKARGALFEQAWPYFLERMNIWRLPVPEGPGKGASVEPGNEAWRAQYRKAFGYRPEPSDTPMVLFRSTAFLEKGWFHDPQLGWGPVARGGLTVYEMPGGHATMFLEPHVQRLAALWKECSQRVREADGGASPSPVP
jgi:thioesterase domain-containing protein